MRAAIATFLLFAAVFFFWYDYFLLAAALFAVSIYIFLERPLHGFGGELMKDLENAEGQFPDKSVWEEGIKEMGSKAGEQAFSDNDYTTNLKSINVTKFRFKGKNVGKASKKTIDVFKKLFG